MRVEMFVAISDQDVDPVRLDESAILLREELLTLEVEDVRPFRGGEVPSGARAVDPATVGALLVVVKDSADLVARIVAAVRSWLRRGPRGQEVELTVGDRTLRLGDATFEQQERLIEEFVRAVSKG